MVPQKTYSSLRRLKKIDESTLKPKEVNVSKYILTFRVQNIWKLLLSRPSELGEIIDKQVLLVCLNLAQSKIIGSTPIFKGSSLSYSSTKKAGPLHQTFNFELNFKNFNDSVRVGSHLSLKFNEHDHNVVSYLDGELYYF